MVASIFLVILDRVWGKRCNHCLFARNFVDFVDPASQLVHIHFHILLFLNSVLNILLRWHHFVNFHAFEDPL